MHIKLCAGIRHLTNSSLHVKDFGLIQARRSCPLLWKIRTEAVSVTFCGSFPLRVLGAICHAFRAASFLLNRNRNKSGSGLHHDDAARFRYAGVSVLLQYYIGDFDSWRIFRFVPVEYEERIDGIVGISDLLVIRIFGKYARHDP